MKSKFEQFNTDVLILGAQRGIQNCLAMKNHKKNKTKIYKEAKSDIQEIRYILSERIKTPNKWTFSNASVYPVGCIVEYEPNGRFFDAVDYMVLEVHSDAVLITKIGAALPVKIMAKPQNLRVKYLSENIEL